MKFSLSCLFISILFFSLNSCSQKKRIQQEVESIPKTLELLENYNIPKLTIYYDMLKMEAMPKDGMYTYIDALELAIESFLTDGSNPESPLAIVPDAIENYKGNVAKSDQQYAKLIELINRGGSLCMPDIERALDSCFYAEEGEDVDKNWIFLLQIPQLSDHLFWAIVPKDGKEKVYNYGFN